MIFRKKKHKKAKFDTGINGYEYMGIEITKEQLFDLMCINTMMKTGTLDDVPVHAIILVMKALGLIPTKMKDEISSDNNNRNPDDNFDNDFHRRFGRFED